MALPKSYLKQPSRSLKNLVAPSLSLFDDGLLIPQHRSYETDIMFKWAQQQ